MATSMHFQQNPLCDISGSESAFLDAGWRCCNRRSLLRPPTFFDPPLLREISLKEKSQVVNQISNPLNVWAFVMNWAGHTKLFAHKGKIDGAVSRPGLELGKWLSVSFLSSNTLKGQISEQTLWDSPSHVEMGRSRKGHLKFLLVRYCQKIDC